MTFFYPGNAVYGEPDYGLAEKYNFAGYGKFAENYDSICRAELPNLVNTQTDEEFSDN